MTRQKIGGLVFFLLLSCGPYMVHAQDVTFRAPESPAPEEWDSPAFTSSRNTRIEWVAFPLPNAGDPQFRFTVINAEGTIIDTREGLEGMGFVEEEARVNLHVTTKQLYTWEIRLFLLKAPPVTTQTAPPHTTSEAPPVTNSDPKIVTEIVTIAVYTALPPASYLVPFGYFMVGVVVATTILLGVIAGLAFKNYEVLLAKRAPPEVEEE
jgi:hypothetical protein